MVGAARCRRSQRLAGMAPAAGHSGMRLVVVLTPGLFWKFYRSDDLLPAYEPVAAEIATRTDKS